MIAQSARSRLHTGIRQVTPFLWRHKFVEFRLSFSLLLCLVSFYGGGHLGVSTNQKQIGQLKHKNIIQLNLSDHFTTVD